MEYEKPWICPTSVKTPFEKRRVMKIADLLVIALDIASFVRVSGSM